MQKRPDPHTFYAIDFLRVALQQKGAPVPAIELILSDLERFASPDKFARWNRVLDVREKQVLGTMLTPEGAPLCDVAIKKMFDDIVKHFGLKAEEIVLWQERFKLN